MPVSFSYRGNDWNQEGESEGLVVFQDGEEVIVLEEAHGSIGNLEVWTGDTLDESLEEFVDEIFQLIDFADLEDFKQLCEEHDFLVRVGEGPVSEQTLNKVDSECWVLAEE